MYWTCKQGKRRGGVNAGRVFQVPLQERRLQTRPDHQRGHQGRLRPLQGENQWRRVDGWTPGAGWVTLRRWRTSPLCTTPPHRVASLLPTRHLSQRFRDFFQCLYHPAKVAAAVFAHMAPKIRSLGLYFTWRAKVSTSGPDGRSASLFFWRSSPSVMLSCSTVAPW